MSLWIAAVLVLQSHKLPKHADAYEKAKGYLIKNLSQASFMEKIPIGLLLLYDGGHPDELDLCFKAACTHGGIFEQWRNWHIGMSGIFLTQYYLRHPGDEAKKAIEDLLAEAAKTQEPSGGWFGHFANGDTHYGAKDHGQLTAMIYSTLLMARSIGLKLPAGVLEKTEAYMDKNCGPGGIIYGTGNGIGDTTGSRGGFAMIGLAHIRRMDHKICSTYKQLLPQCFGRLEKGHHIGGWHFMGHIFGCAALDLLSPLQNAVLDKYVAKMDADGGFYLGDDGDSGGEKGLFGHNYASTAALAMLILLQDRSVLAPPQAASKKSNANPFSQKK